MDKKLKGLFVCDFACNTGFSRVSENIAKELTRKGYEVDVLAINYHGDPHPLQKYHRMFPAPLGNDVYGLNRISGIVQAGNYDFIFMLQDIWLVGMYLERLARDIKTFPPVVYYIPVDAKHIKKSFVEPLNKYAKRGAFYTEFGLQECVESGLIIPSTVIPHGIDQNMYHFMPKQQTKKDVGLDPSWFVVGMVNRSQPRKRLDLGIFYFSEWVKRTNKPDSVKLYYHGALQDIGIDILDYADYCGIGDRMIVTHKDMTMQTMLPEDKLKMVYNSLDVYVTPCASEGWGLTLMEAMACAVPSLAPYSSAPKEWASGGVEYYDVIPDMPFVNNGGVNTIMDTPDLNSYIEKMELLYNDEKYRAELGKKGYRLVTNKKFSWPAIADQFDGLFRSAIV
jgi:D-inositol-3-phosphate glycosyltransferase